MNMRLKSLLISALLLAGQFAFRAQADTVVPCDGCTFSSYVTTAKNAGLGYIYVMDITNARVKLYNVTQDASGYRIASPLTVPTGVQNTFLNILDDRASGKTNVTITVRPTDDFSNTTFSGSPFGAFNNSNAYQIASSNSSQTSLGVNIAAAFAGNTGNTTLDNLGQMLMSTIMSLQSPFSTPITYTIILIWNDGSRTTYTLSSETINEAQYEAGESRDPNGVRIPDQSVSSDGASYAGGYGFPTNTALQNWITAANLAGIPVTGPDTGSRQLRCSWDGQTLTCKYV